MIRDWNEAPEWAMWRARDSSGEVWYYEFKPSKHDKVQMWVALEGRQVFGIYGGSSAGWESSLEKYNEDGGFR